MKCNGPDACTKRAWFCVYTLRWGQTWREFLCRTCAEDVEEPLAVVPMSPSARAEGEPETVGVY